MFFVPGFKIGMMCQLIVLARFCVVELDEVNNSLISHVAVADEIHSPFNNEALIC